jgi:hypothetical protein
MKNINKYIIAFLANGLYIVPTFAAEATNRALDANASGASSLIEILINNQADAEAMIAEDELLEINFENNYDDIEPNGEGGSSDSPGFDPNDDPDVPIDGGISLLVGAGFAYGAARLRKKKEEDEIN